MAPRIEYVVVLMLENRSFDHMLGFLDHPDSDYPGITNESNPDANGTEIPAAATATASLPVSPGHEHREVMQQIQPNGILDNKGFVKQFEQLAASKGHPGLGPEIMRCQSPASIPVLAELAKEFAVCTNWHCSVPGMTWPNRNYAHAGTSDGEVDIVKRFYTNLTIFEQLSEARKDWRIYSDNDAVAQAQAFRNLWWQGWRNRFQGLDTFIRHARHGTLPHYSFIEPDHFVGYSSSQHPMNNIDSNDDFLAGEELIRRIYLALRSSRHVWERSLFLITYDEHGGFFDRQPPPQSRSFGAPPFDTLGPRVPAVVVSPYISKGTIVKDQLFDHTSIIKTVRDIHIPGTESLTVRESVMGSLADIRDLEVSRPDSDVPTFPQRMTTFATRTNGLEAFQKSGIDPEIDEFQESLLWLREEVEREVSREKQVEVFSAAPEKEGTLFRLEQAQAESRGGFRSTGDRLVILHTPSGDAIEQPGDDDIDKALSAASDGQLWIEEVNQAMVTQDPDGRLLLLTEDQEQSLPANVDNAKRVFNLVRAGRHDELTEMFSETSP